MQSLVEILEVLENIALNAIDESIRGNTVVFKVLPCGMIVQNHSSQGCTCTCTKLLCNFCSSLKKLCY